MNKCIKAKKQFKMKQSKFNKLIRCKKLKLYSSDMLHGIMFECEGFEQPHYVDHLHATEHYDVSYFGSEILQYLPNKQKEKYKKFITDYISETFGNEVEIKI